MLVVGAYLAISSVLFQLMYESQPSPFIDEIFHVPQAQKYCQGKFGEWDQKITTLPGMYIISVLCIAPMSLFTSGSACTVWTLRFLNVIFNTCSLLISYLLFKEIWKHFEGNKSEVKEVEKQQSKQWLTSLTIAIFPLLYFYSFLYYTDPGSTFFVLAAYLACIKGRHAAASILGLISIIFRQSNVVWVVFMAGTVVANHLDNLSDVEKINASPEIKDKLAKFLTKMLIFIVRYLLVMDNLRMLLILIWPYLMVVCMFCLFVLFNDGIVVGDRSSHQAVVHLPQLLYCAAFILFFSSPVLITKEKIKRFTSSVLSCPWQWFIAAALCVYVLFTYTHVHPYLLADNRHYVFYIWRWLLGKQFARYMLVPVYLYAMWSICDSLSRTQCFLWKAVLFICVAASVVPQKLLEFRYFILPYVLFRLHIAEQPITRVVLEVLLHVTVNAGTIAVFLLKTFPWPDLVEPQRIIW